ncbi:MAG TPA: class I SAM-dependent methyltransferase [Gallionella sp.]|nr:class I SAM-dependent methyltransferase [Gallionella sp.]
MTSQKPRSPSTPPSSQPSPGGRRGNRSLSRSRERVEERGGPSRDNKDFRNRAKRGGKLSGEQKNISRGTPQPLTGNADASPAIVLKAGREKSLLRRHPWVFSGAVERVDGAPHSGDTLPVRDAAGNFLAWAAYNASSQITARVWSWHEGEVIDAEFFRHKIAAALTARDALGLSKDSSGLRLIHAESDGLPGLVVDRYGDTLVMQIGSAGAECWRDTCADILQELCNPACIYERSDSDSRGLEGLEMRNGVLRGRLPDSVEVIEHGLRFKVDVAVGQKTGFYLDQRDNRTLTETLAAGRDVLNCFCYTGGFSLYALRGGAKSVLSIDASGDALRIAEKNLTTNGLDAAHAEWQEADVFQALRKLRDQGRSFDLIILDPPKFAPTAAFAEKAARGYKDINLLGFKLLRPDGLLATYSCSGGISEELFQKIIAGAALDAGVDAQIIHHLHASADHPVLLSFPEGAYLKGLVLRVAG